MWAKSASRLCECCAPRRTPAPPTMRITSGSVGCAAHHEPELRRLVHDLVEGDAGEVGELQLDDGAQAGEGGADPAADEPALGQRRVADALGPVALVEPLGGAEEAADAADVLTDHDHVRVCGELEVERLADRRDEGEQPRARLGGAGCRRCGAKTDGRRSSDARSLVREGGDDGVLDVRLGLCADACAAAASSAPDRAEPLLHARQGILRSHSSTSAGSRTSGRFARIECCLRRNVFISRNDGPSPARARSSARADGVLDRRQVVAVDDLAGHPVAGGPVGQVFDRALRAPVGGEGELVVLADEDDRQLPGGREVHPLVRRALARRAVPEERDARPGRSRAACAVSPAPHACGMPAPDDAVAAEDVEREVGDVHRAAEPLAVARPLAEHLGHHPPQIGAGRDEVPVRAVVADEVVALPHHARGADGDRLLPDAAVGGAEDDALLEQLLRPLLEHADQAHAAVLLGERRPPARPLGGSATSGVGTNVGAPHGAAAGGTRRRSRRDRASRGSCRPCSAAGPHLDRAGGAEADAARGQVVVERVDVRDEDAEVTRAVARRRLGAPEICAGRGTRAARPRGRCPGSAASRCRARSPPGRRRSRAISAPRRAVARGARVRAGRGRSRANGRCRRR